MPGVTVIRHAEAAGRELLREYVFGGMYGPSRVPRGIDPELVSKYIEEQIQPGSWPSAYARALEVVRFYERRDVLPHLAQALTRSESDAGSIRRAAYVLQAMGDLGTPHDARAAATYLDSALAPLPAAIDAAPALFEAHIALAPDHRLDVLAAHIRAAVDAAQLHEQESEEAMMAYDRLDAIQRNDLPRAKHIADKKAELLAVPDPMQRIEDLAAVYLGQSTAVGPQIEGWAGRMLRMEAEEGAGPAVCRALARGLDAADKGSLPRNIADFVVVRAAQAIVYLGGKLSDAHADRWAKAEGGAQNFLWDDP